MLSSDDLPLMCGMNCILGCYMFKNGLHWRQL